MKRCLIALFAGLCFVSFARAQVDTLWTTTVEHGDYLYFVDGVFVPGVGFTVIGTIIEEDGNYDVGIYSIDNNGTLLSENIYGGNGTQDPRAAARFADGTVLVLGADTRQPDPFRMMFAMGISPEGDSLWTTYIPQVYSLIAFDAVATPAGTVIVTSEMPGNGNLSRDIWLGEFNSSGDTLWTRTYDLGYWDYPAALVPVEDGSIYLAGYVSSQGDTTVSLFFSKINPDLSLAWTQYIHADEDYRIGDMQRTANGDFLLAGTVMRFGDIVKAFVTQIRPNGQVDWYNDQVETDTYNYFNGVAERNPDAIECVGMLTPTFGSHALSVTLNADGEEINRWEDSRDGMFAKLIKGEPGENLACGYLRNAPVPLAGFLALFGENTVVQGIVTETASTDPVPNIRVELDGTQIFDITDALGWYELPARGTSVDIRLSGPCIAPQLHSGLTVIPGQINVYDFTVDFLSYELDPSSVNLAVAYDLTDTAYVTLTNTGDGDIGFVAESRTFSPDYDWLSVVPAAATIPADGSLELAVLIHADSQQGNDFEFFGSVFVHSNACPDTLLEIPVQATALAAGSPPETVREFALHPAYPNPFNSETSLRFDLPRESRVTLALFDVTGRQVRTLTDKDYSAGAYTISIDASALAAGMYFARLQAGNFHAVRKLVYLR